MYEPLPTVEGGFRCVLCDPPWKFKTRSDKGLGRSPDKHYQTMTLDEVCALPVRDIVARSAHLFLWVPGPHLAIGSHIEVMRAWGFKPTATAFVWIKLKRDQTMVRTFSELNLAVGLGFTTRKNAEFCILGRHGEPVRMAKDVREVIIAPAGRHSEKPEEIHRRIERYCPGPRIELFARQAQAGWEGWGDEYQKSVSSQASRSAAMAPSSSPLT